MLIWKLLVIIKKRDIKRKTELPSPLSEIGRNHSSAYTDEDIGSDSKRPRWAGKKIVYRAKFKLQALWMGDVFASSTLPLTD